MAQRLDLDEHLAARRRRQRAPFELERCVRRAQRHDSCWNSLMAFMEQHTVVDAVPVCAVRPVESRDPCEVLHEQDGARLSCALLAARRWPTPQALTVTASRLLDVDSGRDLARPGIDDRERARREPGRTANPVRP
jgi:hypothetical protein